MFSVFFMEKNCEKKKYLQLVESLLAGIFFYFKCDVLFM